MLSFSVGVLANIHVPVNRKKNKVLGCASKIDQYVDEIFICSTCSYLNSILCLDICLLRKTNSQKHAGGGSKVSIYKSKYCTNFPSISRSDKSLNKFFPEKLIFLRTFFRTLYKDPHCVKLFS